MSQLCCFSCGGFPFHGPRLYRPPTLLGELEACECPSMETLNAFSLQSIEVRVSSLPTQYMWRSSVRLVDNYDTWCVNSGLVVLSLSALFSLATSSSIHANKRRQPYPHGKRKEGNLSSSDYARSDNHADMQGKVNAIGRPADPQRKGFVGRFDAHCRGVSPASKRSRLSSRTRLSWRLAVGP
eukprot:735200-Rhodomonas_salina.1